MSHNACCALPCAAVLETRVPIKRPGDEFIISYDVSASNAELMMVGLGRGWGERRDLYAIFLSI